MGVQATPLAVRCILAGGSTVSWVQRSDLVLGSQGRPLSGGVQLAGVCVG